jgi:hypothetical protein
MSNPTHTPEGSGLGSGLDPGHVPAPEVQDRIDFAKIITVGVVSLIIFAVATGWAISILHHETAKLHARGEPRVATEAGKDEIGIVDQVPFDKDHRLEVWKQERQDRLHSYGWVDRKHGVIHIPIERAMRDLIGGAAPSLPAVPLSPPAAGSTP